MSLSPGPLKLNMFQRFFVDGNSSHFGAFMTERFLPSVFSDLYRIDGLTIRCIRATSKNEMSAADKFVYIGDGGLFSDFALSSCDNHCLGVKDKKRIHLNNALFQQLYPDDFTYLLGVVVFLDKMRFYLVPSSVLGKTVKISKQHFHASHCVVKLDDVLHFFIHELNEGPKKRLQLSDWLVKV